MGQGARVLTGPDGGGGPERDRAEGPPHPRYLTVNQACELARICKATFYNLLDDPECGLADLAVRIPGMRRILLPSDRFKSWLESRPVNSTRKTRGFSLDRARG